MAFGKKQRDETAPAASLPDAGDETPGVSDLSGDLFATAEAEAETPEAPAEDPLQPAGDAAPAAGPGDASGDLLNMFQTTQIEEQDRSVVKALAGDVELDDLVEELHVVAAAFGIKVDRESYAA